MFGHGPLIERARALRADDTADQFGHDLGIFRRIGGMALAAPRQRIAERAIDLPVE